MIDTHLGGCACGAVRYRVQGNPVVGTVCHCRFCQKRLASAFAVLASFKEAAVEVLQGELSEVEHRSDESGRWLRMSFCPKCGTKFYDLRKSAPLCPKCGADASQSAALKASPPPERRAKPVKEEPDLPAIEEADVEGDVEPPLEEDVEEGSEDEA